MPRLCDFCPGICLTTEGKARKKNSVRVRKTTVRVVYTYYQKTNTLQNLHAYTHTHTYTHTHYKTNTHTYTHTHYKPTHTHTHMHYKTIYLYNLVSEYNTVSDGPNDKLKLVLQYTHLISCVNQRRGDGLLPMRSFDPLDQKV